MKSIILIRHAQSTSSFPGEIDFDRPLSNQGLKEAELMGDVLVKKNLKLDMIIASSANRALSTAKIISNKIGFHKKIITIKKLYGASPNEILNIVSQLNNNINSIAIFGHNPTLHILSKQLSNEIIPKFPPCSIIKIYYNVNDWEDISSGHLEYYLYPELYVID